jgi:nitrate reductase gamma subunit
MKQILFIVLCIAAFGFFGYTVAKIWSLFKLTKPSYRFDKIGERIKLTLLVAFGQQKMFKRPVSGILHALVWWGFLVITIGTAEMIIDGLFGTERALAVLGPTYDVITASGDIFALIITISCSIFLIRRYIIKPSRFVAVEMKPKSRNDATVILSMILLLMFSLIGLNMGYSALYQHTDKFVGVYPVSQPLAALLTGMSLDSILVFEQTNWWIHITLVLLFLNVLPYSKHFHVIMSVPNVFFSRMEPANYPICPM